MNVRVRARARVCVCVRESIHIRACVCVCARMRVYMCKQFDESVRAMWASGRRHHHTHLVQFCAPGILRMRRFKSRSHVATIKQRCAVHRSTRPGIHGLQIVRTQRRACVCVCVRACMCTRVWLGAAAWLPLGLCKSATPRALPQSLT